MKQGIIALVFLLALAAPALAENLDSVPDVTPMATQKVKLLIGELQTANVQLQAQVEELQRDLTIWHQRALECRAQQAKSKKK